MNRNPPIMRLRLHCLWYDLATLLLPSLRRIYRCASSSRVNVIYATRLSQPFPRNGERERERERGGCRRETNYFPRQHASMLFTAHNELFQLSVERIQNVVPSPPPALYSLRVDIFPSFTTKRPCEFPHRQWPYRLHIFLLFPLIIFPLELFVKILDRSLGCMTRERQKSVWEFLNFVRWPDRIYLKWVDFFFNVSRCCVPWLLL